MTEDTPTVGHNGAEGAQLRAIVERIERVNDEIEELGEDRKEIFAEAKSNGFDVKTLREVIRLRKVDKATFQEREALRDLYLHATGYLD